VAEPWCRTGGLPSMDWIAMIGVGLVGAVALLFTLWVLHRRWRNAGVVDIGWTLAIGMQAIVAALLGTGDPTRRGIIGVIGGGWSLRLATHLIVRVAGTPEDPRYAELRGRWGGNVDAKMLAFFLFQGVLATALAAPFFVAAMDPAPMLDPLFLAGVALAVIAVVGESVADAQLRRFVADPASRGQVCRVGLWGWSRHPNYFFDWLSWCAFVLLALPSSFGWATIGSPLLMLYFLLKVTGIAATEAHAVQSRGAAYRLYQREVSAFVPWPPRRGR
jgi:steroid 5-alpha reductase family enzyme